MPGAEKPAPTSVLDASALLAVLHRENGADARRSRRYLASSPAPRCTFQTKLAATGGVYGAFAGIAMALAKAVSS